MKSETNLPAVLAILLCVLTLAACAPQQLPRAAEQALLDYWASLPSAGEVTHEITRAWQGDTSAAELQPGTQVWCVDAEMSTASPETDGQTARWIIIRAGEDGPWQAILLAAMSSTWPSEACGE